MRASISSVWVALLLASPALTCKDDGGGHDDDAQGSPDQVGTVCHVPDDCYPDVDHADLHGAVICNDRVRDGYCTHECVADEDCCAVEGECETDLPQVCSPFESSGQMTCFLSCEGEDVEAAGEPDEQSFCQHQASPYFICRSSGGGGANRKVCVPGDCGIGADCDEDAHCGGDLECIGDYEGGYCSRRGCESNADCGEGALCVADGDATYCARTCEHDPDCSFCRHGEHAASCTSDVEYAEAGTTGTVCVAPHA